MSLSDGSEQFDIEIEERDYSLLHSEPDEHNTASMSANREDVGETPDTEVHSPTSVGVSLPRPQEIFTPVHDRMHEIHLRPGNIRRFDIGTLIKKFPIPPPLKVPIYGSVPSAGSPTLDGLHPIYYGEDSRVGPYAFYGRFPFFLLHFSIFLFCCIFLFSGTAQFCRALASGDPHCTHGCV